MSLSSPANERLLLSCCLQQPLTVGSSTIALFKGNNPFTDPQLRIIYAVWANAGGREWDRPELVEALDRAAPQYNWFEVTALWREAQPFKWEQYATVVKEMYERRALKSGLEHGLSRLADPEDPLISVVSDLESSLVAAVSTSAQEGPSTSEGFSRIRERAANPGSFVRTGMFRLDRILGPLRPGMVVVVGARPSVGKSIFATNIMAGFGRQGIRAGMFTIEMGIEDQLARMVGAETRTHIGRVDQLSLVPGPVHDTMLEQEEWPLLWNETPGLWLSELRSTVKRWKQRHPDLRVIAIDYLQLVHESGRSREEEIRKISVAIKELCKEEGLVAFVLAQLNRKAEEDGLPKMSHLRESGAIEQDANKILLLDRTVIKSDEQAARIQAGEPDAFRVIVAKNREGGTGVITQDLYPMYCLIDDKEPEQ